MCFRKRRKEDEEIEPEMREFIRQLIERDREEVEQGLIQAKEDLLMEIKKGIPEEYLSRRRRRELRRKKKQNV